MLGIQALGSTLRFAAKRQTVKLGATREVTLDELRTTDLDTRPKPQIKKIRDYHHNLARMVAMGLRSGEIAQAMGMSVNRIQLMIDDPAFADLVSKYREAADDSWKMSAIGVLGTMMENHARAQRLIGDQLEEAEETGAKIPLGTLVKVASDTADRVGFGKHSTLTVDQSDASKLDRAIERSRTKTIEGKALPAGSATAGAIPSGPPEPAGLIEASTTNQLMDHGRTTRAATVVHERIEQPSAVDEPIRAIASAPQAGENHRPRGIAPHQSSPSGEWDRVREARR